MTEGFTATTPVPLYWTRHGPADGERLLVLHGGPGAHHDYLLPQMLQLARDRECVFYDQRGGGRSRHDDDRATITWESQVRDCEAVVRELALAPLTLVGYSWGGLLALLYAVQAAHGRATPAPARLVLIDPAPASRASRGAFEAEFTRRQAGPVVRALREELAGSGLRERDPEAYRQRAFELSVAGYFAHPERAQSLTPFRVTGRVQQSIWESLGDFDLIPALRDVRCPALVVHGRQDPIPLESSTAVARALGAELVVLDDCGHVPYVEQPDALFGAVRSFLDRTPPRRA
ncbi:MAG: alpha/beta fold hydrolase [Gemmatimonadaceae bacterium]